MLFLFPDLPSCSLDRCIQGRFSVVLFQQHSRWQKLFWIYLANLESWTVTEDIVWCMVFIVLVICHIYPVLTSITSTTAPSRSSIKNSMVPCSVFSSVNCKDAVTMPFEYSVHTLTNYYTAATFVLNDRVDCTTLLEFVQELSFSWNGAFTLNSVLTGTIREDNSFYIISADLKILHICIYTRYYVHQHTWLSHYI